MKKACGFVCMALGLFLGVSQSKADTLVVNGGFETGNFTGWTLSGNDVAAGTLGNLYGVEGTDPFDGGPNSGSYQAFFGDLVPNATTLSQNIATVAGDSYTVSFYLLQDTPASDEYGNELIASFGGTTLIDATDVPVQGYTEYSYTLDATSASSQLSLTLGDGLGYFLLDDVSVTSNTAPTPEPSTWMLLLTGTIGGALLYRRSLASSL